MYQENDDPVAICIEALKSGKNKQHALEKAKTAHEAWWAISSIDSEMSEEEIQSSLVLRAIVLCTVATVYVWNGDFKKAYDLEDQFLYIPTLWTDANRQVIEGYVAHLIYQKQFEHLVLIFQEKTFRKEFLHLENIYKSVLDKDYEIKGNRLEFIPLFNRLNNYCRTITGVNLL